MGEDKRRTPRIQPFVAPCRVLEEPGPRGLTGYLTDLSPRGAQVATQGLPPVPEVAVVLEVRLGADAAATRLPARVKWVRAAEHGDWHAFGLVFEAVSPEEQRLLDAVVDDFRRRAAQLDRA
jgi:PilZ domain-containing protein